MEDADLLRLIGEAELTGIDAPFGWPVQVHRGGLIVGRIRRLAGRRA